MDLSFFRSLERQARDPSQPPLALWEPDLPVLLAATSALQAACPTARMLAGTRRAQQEEAQDWIQALADMLAPRGGDGVGTGLDGSFHPDVAASLTKEVR